MKKIQAYAKKCWPLPLLLVACKQVVAPAGAQAPTTQGVLNATDFVWTLGQGNTPINGTITLALTSAACQVTAGGYTFPAAKVGRPIRINDANLANSETVVPTAVVVLGSSCTIQAPMTHTHSSYSLSSGTYGLQEALDYNATRPPSVVTVDPNWAKLGGTTAMITSATGYAGVSINDARSAPFAAYTWNGTHYVITGGAASVTATSIQQALTYTPAASDLSNLTNQQAALANIGALPLHGTADKATALASTPTLCSTGQFPLGISANGNAVNCAAPPQASVTATAITSALQYTPVANDLSNLSNQQTALTNLGALPLHGTADKAQALAATPKACNGQAAAGVDASGNAVGCFNPTTSATTPSNSVPNQFLTSSGPSGNLTAATGVTQRIRDNAIQALNSAFKGPSVDASHTDFAVGCSNADDPSGAASSQCAIQNALNYSAQQAASTGTPPIVILPPGLHKISGSLVMAPGQCMRGASLTSTILQEVDPEADLVVYGPGTLGTGGSVPANSYIRVGCLADMTLAGNGQPQQGSLLELDTSFFVGSNLQIKNTGGRGISWQGNSERTIFLNTSLYADRWGADIAADANESGFTGLFGVGNGITQDNYCYADGCVNGSLPAAGSAGSTTLPFTTHAAVTVRHATNFWIDGGDMKDNRFSSAFQILDPHLLHIASTYCEASDYGVLEPRTANCILLGGVPARATITPGVAATTGTIGGNSYTLFKATGIGWIPDNFGTIAYASSAGGPFSYTPYVVIPPDFKWGSTAASVCPGITQGQYEFSGSATSIGHTDANAQILLWSRNGNGVYNASSNPTGVPANYDWSTCSQPATFEDDILAGYDEASVELTNVHSQTNQGANPQNGWQFDTSHLARAGGMPGDFAAYILPALSGPDFFTAYDAPGNPVTGYAQKFNVVLDGNLDLYLNSSGAPYGGQFLAATGLSVTASAHAPDYGGNGDAAAYDPNATVPASDGTKAVSFAGEGNLLKVYPGVDGAFPPVDMAGPAEGQWWNLVTGAYIRPKALNSNSANFFFNGTQFANDWFVYDDPSGDATNGGQLPSVALHLFGGPKNTLGSGMEVLGCNPKVQGSCTPLFSVTKAGVKGPSNLSAVSLANGSGGLGGTVSFSPSGTSSAALTLFSVTSSAAGSTTQGATLFTATFSPALPATPACTLQGLNPSARSWETDIYEVGSSASSNSVTFATMGSAIPPDTYNWALRCVLP